MDKMNSCALESRDHGLEITTQPYSTELYIGLLFNKIHMTQIEKSGE